MDPSTLSLSWLPPLPERRNGFIQQYIISITDLETGMTQLVNTTEQITIVSDLHPFYRYSYTVAAETAVGRGPYSVVSLIHMPEAGS